MWIKPIKIILKNLKITCFMNPVYCDFNFYQYVPLFLSTPLYQYITVFYSTHVLLLICVVHTSNNVTCVNKVCIGPEQGYVIINSQKRVYQIYHMCNFQKFIISSILKVFSLNVTILGSTNQFFG
jgi:hypothetical protein